MKRASKPTQFMIETLKKTASRDSLVRASAERDMCEIIAAGINHRVDERNKVVLASEGRINVQALETPIRQGIMSGDLITPIFEQMTRPKGSVVRVPLDILVPGTESDWNGYAIPRHGNTAVNMFRGDYILVPTYEIGTAVGWTEEMAELADWDMVGRAYEVSEAGLIKKKNDDGFHVIISAGAARNAVIYDQAANQGQFTTKLVSLLKTYVRRNGGGNTSSTNRFKLTHLYTSPEAIESMRAWGLDIVDDVTRREIYVMEDGSVNRVYQVNLVDIDELGVGQEYQLYFQDDLGGQLTQSGGSHAHNDVELVIGLDLSRQRSFIMPTVGETDVREDVTAHFERRRRYRWVEEVGFACLDNRTVVLGSY